MDDAVRGKAQQAITIHPTSIFFGPFGRGTNETLGMLVSAPVDDCWGLVLELCLAPSKQIVQLGENTTTQTSTPACHTTP